MSLIDDLFPNMTQEKGYHNQLTTAIVEIVNELGLVNHAPWTLKLIQVSLEHTPELLYLVNNLFQGSSSIYNFCILYCISSWKCVLFSTMGV